MTEGNSGNGPAADYWGRDWAYLGGRLVATSDDSSGPCVGYLASEPCLALAVGVEGRHLELIVRKTLVGNEVKLTHSLSGHHTLHTKLLLWTTWGVSGAAWWMAWLI